MDKRFVILLLIATIVSIYEVVSNNHDQKEAGRNDRSSEQPEKDSFRQFDDVEDEEPPAYKYTEEAQNEQQQSEDDQDQVLIREPAGRDTKDTFKPPINMPPVRFAFCVSCGYRQAYDQFAQILREKYPGIDVQGENYPPGIVRSLSAQIIGFTKIAVIVCIVMGRDPFPAIGVPTPTFFQWMINNKMSASILVFLFSNSIEGMLQSTGAFEIYIESEQIWSKIESGRVPSPPELFQAIDSYIAISGGNKFTSGFGIDDSS